MASLLHRAAIIISRVPWRWSELTTETEVYVLCCSGR